MKKSILFLLVTVTSVCVQAQSLKDLLYGGKLKNDSNSVVRKTDDLSTKIDTTTKKPEPAKTAETAIVGAPAKKSAATTDAIAADPARRKAEQGSVAQHPARVHRIAAPLARCWADTAARGRGPAGDWHHGHALGDDRAVAG